MAQIDSVQPNINISRLLDGLDAGVVVHRPDTTIAFINPRALEILKLSKQKTYEMDAYDPNWHFIDVYGKKLSFELYPVNQVLRTGCVIEHQVYGILTDNPNEPSWVKVNAYPEINEHQEMTAIVVSFVDVTAQMKPFSFENIVRLSNDVVVVTKAIPLEAPGPYIVYVNEAFTDLTGYTPEEVLDKSPRMLQGEKTDHLTKLKIRQALTAGEPVRETILNYGKSGESYWLDINIVPLRNYLGVITHFVAIERDVTAIKKREFHLQNIANHDSLTGLLNRRGFAEMAEVVEAQAKRYQRNYSVLAIDLDYFKLINDRYGHDIGDKVLKYFAHTFQEMMRKEDVLGRNGGEEFVAVLPETDSESAKMIAERLRNYINSHPLQMTEDLKITCTASFGIVESKSSRDCLQALLKQADAALYSAKSKGRNCVVVLSN